MEKIPIKKELRRRLVVISYEFTYCPFSGNGILARSLVKALLQLECQITVWCCKPHMDDDDERRNSDNHLKYPEIDLEMELDLIPIELSKDQGWRKLDDGSAWESFVFHNLDGTSQKEKLKRDILNADAIIPIDWTGAHALRSMKNIIGEEGKKIPIFYLNFRVYSSGISDGDRREWFDLMERNAVENASSVVVLSECDQASLQKILSDVRKRIHVVFPPLRSDMHNLSYKSRESLESFLPPEVLSTIRLCGEQRGNYRSLLTCVVRLSREKSVLRFVRFVEQSKTFLDKTGIIPFLTGANTDKIYASNIKERLLQAAPNSIIITDRFLTPNALASIFSRSILNFHPCSYDAYGMTIIEAAACGVPSVVAKGGRIGASKMIDDSFIGVDMPIDENELSKESVNTIIHHLEDYDKLRSVGENAKKKALIWDEIAYGKKILQIIDNKSQDKSI